MLSSNIVSRQALGLTVKDARDELVAQNQYWPALYFIDAHGRVRQHHFGEGEYGRSEMAIQRLLAEAGAGGPRDGVVSVDAGGVEMAADWDSLKSPEKYVGYDRTENFASAGGGEVDLRDVNQGRACLRVRLSRFGEDPPGARFGHRRGVRDPIRVRKWG